VRKAGRKIAHVGPEPLQELIPPPRGFELRLVRRDRREGGLQLAPCPLQRLIEVRAPVAHAPDEGLEAGEGPRAARQSGLIAATSCSGGGSAARRSTRRRCAAAQRAAHLRSGEFVVVLIGL
jgi:hypothetical protein